MDDQHDNQLSVSVGRPTTYDQTYHDNRVIELAEQCMSIHEISRELKKSVKTLYNWCQHESFADALDRARDIRTAILMHKAYYNLNSETFRDRTFEILLNHSMHPPTVRLPELKECKTFSDRCNVIIAAAAESRITTQQAETLTNIVKTSAQVEEITELKAKLKMIEEKIGE